MQTSFTDLVGTAVVPAHCFDSHELTDLAPVLNTAAAVVEMGRQASEAAPAAFTPTGVAHCNP